MALYVKGTRDTGTKFCDPLTPEVLAGSLARFLVVVRSRTLLSINYGAFQQATPSRHDLPF